MAYRSFREFLSSLEKEGELKRITIPVDTNLLVAEWDCDAFQFALFFKRAQKFPK